MSILIAIDLHVIDALARPVMKGLCSMLFIYLIHKLNKEYSYAVGLNARSAPCTVLRTSADKERQKKHIVMLENSDHRRTIVRE
jgi:hypothetical protein